MGMISSDGHRRFAEAVQASSADHPPAADGQDRDSPAISLVIPAFNEEKRLPAFLDTVRPYLSAVYGVCHEVIVVDDGSRDRSAGRVEQFRADWPQLQLLRHANNRGKGRAVRTGVLASRGRLVLFSDADGAAPIDEEETLRSAIAAGADIAIGTRRLVGGHGHCSRRWHRGAIGYLFSQLVRVGVGLNLQDTQCGFKMFRGLLGRKLFQMCSRDDYLFDIFVLLAAKRLGYSIAEVAVRWHDVPGSRVRLVRDSWKMATGLVRIRREVSRTLARESEKTVSPAPRTAKRRRRTERV